MRHAMLALALTILAGCGADTPPEPPEERDSPHEGAYGGVSVAP